MTVPTSGPDGDLAPPPELMARVRWVFLGIALLNLVVILLVAGSTLNNPQLPELAAAAGASWLGWWWVRCYRRGDFPIWPELLSAAGLLAVVLGGHDPEYALGVLCAGATLRALYTGVTGSLAVAAEFEAAYLVGVGLQSGWGHAPIPAAYLLLGLPGIALAVAIGQLLKAAVERHQKVLDRAQRLRDAGIGLASATTPERVQRALTRAAQDLTGGFGTVQVAWVQLSGGTIVVAHPGMPELGLEPAVRRAPASIPAPVLPVLLGAKPLGEDPVIASGILNTLGLNAGFGGLLVVPLSPKGEPRGSLVVASRGALPAEVADAFRTLATQAWLALSRADLSLSIRQSEARFRGLVQNSNDLVVALGADYSVTYVSPSVELFLGGPLPRLQLPISADLVHPQDLVRVMTAVQEVIASGAADMPDLRVRRGDREWRVLEVQATNLLEDPDVGALVMTARDVTERKALEERLRQQALHDPLTGLANRLLLRDRIDHALHARRSRLPLGLLIIDLDGFKNINDSYGHAAGDAALLEVTNVIQLCLRPGDTFARLGGDEFAVLLEELSEASFAEAVAARIGSALEDPVRLPNGEEVAVTVSVGVVTCDRYEEPEVLLRNADIALYAAKAEGRERYVVFRDFLHQRALQRMHVENGLRQALEKDQLRLEFQPMVGSSGHPVGLEALLRWSDPERGLLLPDEFVAIAEATGVIVPLGRWVLAESCRQIGEWLRSGLLPAGSRVAINVSARQLQEEAILGDVEASLAASGLSADQLMLEVTESAITNNPKAMVARLASLRGMGVRIAIDDFGTGQSSLAQLQVLPVDAIKIDQSFVQRLGADPAAAAVLQSVVELGRALHLEVVVEGVETAAQARLLAKMCRDATRQGHYFSPPMGADEIESGGLGELLHQPARQRQRRGLEVAAKTAV